MPRKAKDTTIVEEKNIVKNEAISKKISNKNDKTNINTLKSNTKATKKESNSNSAKSNTKTSLTSSNTIKNSTKSSKKIVEKEIKPNITKSRAKKTDIEKKDAEKKAKPSTAKNNTKKSKAEIKSTTKKSTNKRKVNTSKKTTIKTKKEAINKIEILEYYDLPYRYNQTVVKIIAQTPNTLFVYWDISDEDKQNYIKQYGEYFYNNTKPVLIIHNITKNYSFELDINDYANSWYLKVKDSKCDYKIELGRRGINKYIDIPNNYLYISSSNELEIPNDHILFDNLPDKIYFKNIKTGKIIEKNISSISFLEKFSKIYNITDFYKLLYTNKNFTFEEFNLKSPSSGNPTSTFK